MTDGRKRSLVESSRAHDRHQESNRTAGALSRRNHDRHAIVARSSRRRSHLWTPYDRNSIALKSKPDRQAIVARSLSNRAHDFGYSTAESRQNQGHDSRNQSHVQSAASTPSNSLHNHFNCPRFLGQFPL